MFQELYQTLLVANKSNMPITINENVQIPDALQLELPHGIEQHLKSNSRFSIAYNNTYVRSSLAKASDCVTVTFIAEHPINRNEYDIYARWVFMWLEVVKTYTRRTCFKKLNVQIFHSSLTKRLPPKNEIISEEHANTAFTTICNSSEIAQIVVFRKEEWFKVFIHETFHTFGLDFSGAAHADNCIVFEGFPHNLKLYEAYTETWARIIFVLFKGFWEGVRRGITTYHYPQKMLAIESRHSLKQLTKVLAHNNLTYRDLFDPVKLHTQYRENTAVLSYYVISGILMQNIKGFVSWCERENGGLCFKSGNIRKFCDWVKGQMRMGMSLNINAKSSDKSLRMTASDMLL